MDRLRLLRTFVSVAEHASFAEAARRLNLSPTTVTRSIAALEASLGVALLMRTTRSVRLTEEGALFLERCRAGIAEIDQAFDAVRGSALAPRGTLTVTAPVMFGRLHVLPIVTEMLGLYPELRVRLLLLDRIVRQTVRCTCCVLARCAAC
jgi:DNA-binding transcriptional LysR family regulator